MKNNLIKLIISILILLIGFFGSFVVKYLPQNIIGLIFLIFLSVCKFGGFILLVVSLIKIFSKEKIENEISYEAKIVRRNRLLIYSIVLLVFGLLFCFSSFLLPYTCNKNDIICPVASVGVSLFFFIPVGVVLFIIGLLKLYRFFKK
ncbi:MAG: hypothetical protein WCO07_00780 [bacterium]